MIKNTMKMLWIDYRLIMDISQVAIKYLMPIFHFNVQKSKRGYSARSHHISLIWRMKLYELTMKP